MEMKLFCENNGTCDVFRVHTAARQLAVVLCAFIPLLLERVGHSSVIKPSDLQMKSDQTAGFVLCSCLWRLRLTGKGSIPTVLL
jgi:hypothetical protein